MTPLRLAVAVSDEAQSFALRTLLERLCHTIVAEIPPSGLLQLADRESVDLIVLDQGAVAFAEVLARVAGLREVSALPVLIVATKAEPSLVDQLLEWSGTGLVYAPADVRNLYHGIASAIAACERERRYRMEIEGLRAMLGGMRGALLSTDASGRVYEISADACVCLDCTAERALGARIEELLGIPEPLAMLALRGGEHELKYKGKSLKLNIRQLGDGEDWGEGWLVTLTEAAQTSDPVAQAQETGIRIIPLEPEGESNQSAFTLAAGMARDYQPHFRSLSLSVVARDVASQAVSASQTRGLRIQVEPNMRAVADENLLRELLELLVRVCRSATYGLPNGQVRVGQRVTADRTVFFVYDNGRGDDPARNEFLSDRLSEAGFGRVERIVSLHGGVCGFKLDEVGRGATVFFTLPGRRSALEQRSSTSTAA